MISWCHCITTKWWFPVEITSVCSQEAAAPVSVLFAAPQFCRGLFYECLLLRRSFPGGLIAAPPFWGPRLDSHARDYVRFTTQVFLPAFGAIWCENCGSFLTASTEEDMEKQIKFEAQEEDSVVASGHVDTSQMTPFILYESMVKTELAGCLSAATEMEVAAVNTLVKHEVPDTEVCADMPLQLAPYVYDTRASAAIPVKIQTKEEMAVEHTAASSAAPDAQDSLKIHRCETHGPHVCTWTTVPTPEVPPEVYATVGLTMEFESALEKMSEFIFHFHQALHKCIVQQDQDNMPRIMMCMAEFAEVIDEDDTSRSNLLDLSMLKIFSIMEMDGASVKTQNRVFEPRHDDFMFVVLLENPFEDLKEHICGFIKKQHNLKGYKIDTYIADNLHKVEQQTDFSPAKIVTRVCDEWPDIVEMHEYIVFHVKRYRIMISDR